MHIDKRMTTVLVSKAMVKAYKLCQPPKGLVFYSDRDSQYTKEHNRKSFSNYGIRTNMGVVGAPWD